MWKFLKAVAAGFSDWDEKVTEFHTEILQQRSGAFGETPSEIDRHHMLTLAYLCHFAYVAFRDGEHVVRKGITSSGTPIGRYRNQASFFPGNEQYMSFSVCSDTDLVFVFRGSADIRDWLENISVALVGGEQIHAGFDRVTEQLWPWVIQTAIERLSSPDNTINRLIFTGHSLGGALAVLLSHRMQQMQGVLGKDITIQTYTFGQPKVGSSAIQLGFPLVAFKAIGDMIPELTATSLYKSHGRAYLLSDRFRIIAGPDVVLMGLLNWSRMLGDIGKRMSYLIHTFSGGNNDAEVWRFLVQPFRNFCHPIPEMFEKYGDNTLLVMPVFIHHFMTDSGRTRRGDDNSFLNMPEPVIGLGEHGFRMMLYNYLDDALLNREAMIELSRTQDGGSMIMKAFALLVMKERHTIANYINGLSLGAIRTTI